MAQSSASVRLDDQFNEFQRCGLWPDRDAAPLSVLSALARLDVDPWEAAARLAELPEPSACAQLASMLANLPGGPAVRRTESTDLLSRVGQLFPSIRLNGHPVPMFPGG